jgi:hypothetical protein
MSTITENSIISTVMKMNEMNTNHRAFQIEKAIIGATPSGDVLIGGDQLGRR